MVADAVMFKRVEGPLSVTRCCTRCGFHVTTRKMIFQRSSLGRGHGFVVGNRARGEMIQHFKVAHPSEYAAAKE